MPLFIRITLAVSLAGFFNYPMLAQKKQHHHSNYLVTGELGPKMKAIETEVYKRAITIGDYSVAIHAIYHLMAMYPEELSYLDSLATLYFTIGAYQQCIKASDIYLKKGPDYIKILDFKAASHKVLVDYKNAVDIYEKLYKLTDNALYLYQVAELQYALKRFGECEASATALIDRKDIGQMQIDIAVNKEEMQAVSLKAAALNMRGMLYSDVKEYDLARKSFNGAQEESPNFSLPVENIKILEKREKEK